MFDKGDVILYKTIYHQEWLRGGFIEYSTNTSTTIIDGVNYTSDPYEVITFTNKQHKVITMKKHEVTIIPYNDTNKNLEFTNGKPYISKFKKWKKINNIKPGDIVEVIQVSKHALVNCYKRDYCSQFSSTYKNSLFKIVSFTELGVNIQSIKFDNSYHHDIPYVILSKLDTNRESDKNRLAKFNLQTGERTLRSLLDDKLFKNYQYKFNKWIEENKIQKNTKIKLHTYMESKHPYLEEISKKYHYATGIFPFVPKNGYIVNTTDKDCLVMVKFWQEHNPDKIYFSKVPYELIEVIPELNEIDIEMVIRVNGSEPYSIRRKVLLNNNTLEHEIKFEDIEVILNDKQEHLLTVLNKIKLNKTNNYQKRELLLVRNEDTDIWNFGLYLETYKNSVLVKTNLDTHLFKQHVRYLGNEHLAYTKDEPDNYEFRANTITFNKVEEIREGYPGSGNWEHSSH